MMNSSNSENMKTNSGIQANRKFTATIFFWLYAAGTLAISLSFLALRLTTASDGARQEPGEQGISPAGLKIRLITAQPVGLHDGDIVIAVEDMSLDDWLTNLFNPNLTRPVWHAGGTLSYTILRNEQEMVLPARLIDYPLREVIFRNWSTLLFVIISQLVISIVFILNPRETSTRALFIWAWSLSHTYVWSFGLQVSDFTNGLSFGLYQAATGILWFIYWGAFLHFVLAFPHKHELVKRFPSLMIWAYILPFMISAVYLLIPGWPINSLDLLSRFVVSEWVAGAVVTLLWLVILLEGYRNRFTFSEKKKARWIIYSGLICGGLGFVFFLLPASIFSQSIIPGHMLGLLLIPFPVSLAISVYRHQLFDIDIIIRKTLLYTSLTIVLGMAYFGGIVLLQSLFQRITGESNQLAIVISTVGIASLANPLRKWIQKEIDRRFFRTRYNSEQAIAAFVSSARNEVDLSQLSSRLSAIVFDSLKPMYLSIWLKKSSRKNTGLDKAWNMLVDQDNETGG